MGNIKDTERKHYEAALAVKPPIAALRNRVLVIQIREEQDLIKDDRMSIPGLQGRDIVKHGDLYIPAEAKEKGSMKENDVVKGLIKSIGPAVGESTGIALHDLVLVFPNVFETKISIDGFDYFVYSEYDLVAKFDASAEDIYDHSRMD
jgi:hypothetical protein